MIHTHPVLAAAIVIAFALLVLWRVRVDYGSRGRLTRLSAVLQFLMFFVHGLASYSFLDSRYSRIVTTSPLLALALGLMALGLAGAVTGMSRLQWSDTVGRSVTGLRQSGLYRLTRNPQLMAYFVFLAGYALLWPSWLGLAWLGLYAVIAHLMILTEERHLRHSFGHEYVEFCRETPRYLGLPDWQ